MPRNKTRGTSIWQTADDYLRLVLPGENYGDYILPFTVLRRLEGRLAASKEALLALVQEETSKATEATLISLKIQQRFGLRFWNTSESVRFFVCGGLVYK